MKTYLDWISLDERATASQETLYDELVLFQFLLRNSEELNMRYRGNAQAIADGLEPWIEALRLSLSENYS